jgi:hypothetical protein
MAATRKQVDGHAAASSIDGAGIVADGTTWPACR